MTLVCLQLRNMETHVWQTLFQPHSNCNPIARKCIITFYMYHFMMSSLATLFFSVHKNLQKNSIHTLQPHQTQILLQFLNGKEDSSILLSPASVHQVPWFVTFTWKYHYIHLTNMSCICVCLCVCVCVCACMCMCEVQVPPATTGEKKTFSTQRVGKKKQKKKRYE